MNSIVRVTVLVENTARGSGTLAEHGLAVWIEAGSRRILFDTGQGMVLGHNAQRLGVSLGSANHVVLSHGHYDHCGGLSEVLDTAAKPKVWIHPKAFDPKYGRNRDGTGRENGMSAGTESKIRQQAADLILTRDVTEIGEGLFVTGEIPRVTDYEDTGGPFFLDKECRKPDLLPDDQAIFFDSSQGTVVLLGCAHAGVINTLLHIQRLTNHRPIYAVMGGMHLGAASPERMDRTIAALREMNVERLGPAHCTGLAATVRLWEAFPGRCVPWNISSRMEFEVS
jgi:7,8-dihydropterin-6-yl-methyl-4-(beta-D-ribofuranosyl)aminobenzene 5'-phosphate synthase